MVLLDKDANGKINITIRNSSGAIVKGPDTYDFTTTDEDGNQVEQYPATNSAGNKRVTLGVEASLIYDEKTYFGNVNYYVDVYENDELIATYNSENAETAFMKSPFDINSTA